MIILRNVYEKRKDKHYSRHVLENKNAFVPLYVSFARKENRHSRMIVNWILKFYNETTFDWHLAALRIGFSYFYFFNILVTYGFIIFL